MTPSGMQRPGRRVDATVGKSSGSSAFRILGGTLGLVLKIAFVAVAVATPVLAIWIASSMVAYQGGRIWVAALLGLSVFPGLPLVWELFATWRRRRSRSTTPPVLTGFDRFVLRTLAIGIGFLAIVVARDPGEVFVALSTRGDWMLDGRTGRIADGVRGVLLDAAGTLEWLHEATHRNRFAEHVDASATQTQSPVLPTDDVPIATSPSDGASPPATDEAPRSETWPYEPTLHPAVAVIPDAAEATPEGIGQYLAAAEPDPTLRLKAVHDYVADRIAYDAVALRQDRYPDQSAEAVLQTRVGVCAGYANLVAAIGNAAGIETVVVVGDARTGTDGFGDDDAGHAWNAARLGERWVLLDATWDAGAVGTEGFMKEYSTEYFMAPPAAFGLTHLPEEPRWQLRHEPLDRAAFLRQPAMRPRSVADGLRLVSPATPVVEVGDVLEIEIENPRGVRLSIDIARADEPMSFASCDGAPSATCRFERPGSYDVRIFASGRFVGAVRAHARP